MQTQRYKSASESTFLPSIYKPTDDARDIESAEKRRTTIE